MTPPKAGDVWSYDFLWHHEHDRGSEHGRKPRPSAIIAAVTVKDGRINLFILPITTKAPDPARVSILVPQIERKRAGLSLDMNLWIMLDEYNHEFLETTFHIDPGGKIGSLSPLFADKVFKAFRDVARAGRAKRVPRGE